MSVNPPNSSGPRGIIPIVNNNNSLPPVPNSPLASPTSSVASSVGPSLPPVLNKPLVSRGNRVTYLSRPPLAPAAPGATNWKKVTANLIKKRRNALAATNLGTNGPKTVSLKPNNLRVIPFYESMNTDAKAHFKAQVNAIVAVNQELAKLGAEVQELQIPLATATNAVKTLKLVNAGDKTFRGKNGPQVYLAPTANGKDVEIRLNFTVEGRPIRVTNDKSFNAVLAKMRTRRQNALTKTTSLKKALDLSDSLQKKYNLKQQEIAKLVKRLQKDHEEYVARRAKNVRASRKTILASKAPSVVTNAARTALAPPKKPGFFSRVFGKGGTRKNSNSRTRKNNRK